MWLLDPFFILFALLILFPILRFLIRKRREDEYFRRMYWTMRQAEEDSKRNKDDTKFD